jgi:lambda family phage minor tail protein L
MKSLPANIILEKNKLHTPYPWIVLIEITLTDDTVLRYAKNTANVTFGGNVYTAMNFDIEPTQQTSKGEIPTVTLRVSNITRLLQPYLEDLDGGIGSTVKVTVVNTNLLAESYSELEMTFDVLACNATARWASFILGSPSPLRQRFPLYRFIAEHCRWQFEGAECGYVGAESSCDRTYADCVTRENTEHFGGFMGMKSGGIEIA